MSTENSSMVSVNVAGSDEGKNLGTETTTNVPTTTTKLSSAKFTQISPQPSTLIIEEDTCVSPAPVKELETANENICLDCGSEFTNTLRRVIDDCGHAKCAKCFVLCDEKEECKQCLAVRNTITEKTPSGVKFRNTIALTEDVSTVKFPRTITEDLPPAVKVLDAIPMGVHPDVELSVSIEDDVTPLPNTIVRDMSKIEECSVMISPDAPKAANVPTTDEDTMELLVAIAKDMYLPDELNNTIAEDVSPAIPCSITTEPTHLSPKEHTLKMNVPLAKEFISIEETTPVPLTTVQNDQSKVLITQKCGNSTNLEKTRVKPRSSGARRRSKRRNKHLWSTTKEPIVKISQVLKKHVFSDEPSNSLEATLIPAARMALKLATAGDKICLECGIEYNTTNHRKLFEECGHVVCWECFLSWEDGCQQCVG